MALPQDEGNYPQSGLELLCAREATYRRYKQIEKVTWPSIQGGAYEPSKLMSQAVLLLSSGVLMKQLN